jgi:hypothetical protein
MSYCRFSSGKDTHLEGTEDEIDFVIFHQSI